MYNYTVCGVEDTQKRKRKKKVNPAIILQPYYAILAILKKILTNVVLNNYFKNFKINRIYLHENFY